MYVFQHLTETILFPGIKRVIIPAGNVSDLEKIDPQVKESLEFIPCREVSEVLANVLVDVPSVRFEIEKKTNKRRIRVPEDSGSWIRATTENR